MTNPTSPMLAKMARAIHEEIDGGDADELIHHPAAKSWEEPTEPRWTQWTEVARAALQSLKDLDEGTVEAMAQELRDARDYTDRTQALRAFTCGINHILKDGEP